MKPINGTTIDVELEKALFEEDYILKTPIINGAKDGMLYLWQNHFVLVATLLQDLLFSFFYDLQRSLRQHDLTLE